MATSSSSSAFSLGQSSLERWVSDWFQAEWAQLRGRALAALPFDAPLEGPPFVLDSMDLLTLASRASDYFCVRDSGVEDYFLARRTLAEWTELIRTSWDRSAAPSVAFLTSGSTGTPVAHRHELNLLEEEIRFFDALLPSYETLRQSVPAHHIYGFLFTVLLPDFRRSPVVRVEAEAPVWSSKDLLVTHPVHLSLWKQRGLRLPAGLRVVSSTSALAEEVWDWLHDQGCEVWEIFGSSETAGLGYRTGPGEAFTLLPYWNHREESEGTRFQRPGLGQTILLPDHLDFTSPNQFLPRGRRDQGIKVAGRLVFLNAVRDVLQSHPLVAQCAVKTEFTPNGQRVAAFVVPQGAGHDDALETELRTWASERLETGARPHRYAFGPQVPQKQPGQPSW